MTYKSRKRSQKKVGRIKMETGMKKKGKKKIIEIVLTATILAAGCFIFYRVGMGKGTNTKTGQNEVLTFSLAEVHTKDFPATVADEKFAELVSEQTNGRIIITVVPDAQLGEETGVIEQLQAGELGFARVSAAPVAEYSDKMNVLLMPYLFKNSDHMWRVLDGEIGDEMLDAVSEAGLTGLSWYDSGARSFYSKKKITSMEDLENARFRVQTSSMMYAMCEALGCVPKTVPENEIVSEVRKGVIDGAENNLLTYASYEQFKVCPYYLVDEHTRIPDILVGSQAVMEGISEEDQEIIRACAKEAAVYERQLWQDKETEVMEDLTMQGVTFIQLSEAERMKMKNSCVELYSEFTEQYQDIIKKINDLG